jgi:catechol-2,3-dioxygenase
VLGITDHGFVKSIYFFDPNGIRLEFTAETATPEEMKDYAKNAHASLAAWTKDKSAAHARAKS